MTSSEFQFYPFLLMAILCTMFLLILAVLLAALFGKRFLFSDAYSKPIAALFALFIIPIWGGGISVFGFEVFGDRFFDSLSVKNAMHRYFLVALFILWMIVIIRFLYLIAKGVRLNPGIAIGVIAVFLILGAFLAASYLFELPFFDVIDVPNGV